jgi:formylmethanofuran dehydrogenase subunit C
VRRIHSSVLAAALGVAGCVVVVDAAPASAVTTTTCNGTLANQTVLGPLSVPAGASCTTTNVSVNGNVTVGSNANLTATGGTVTGNVSVQSNAYLQTSSVKATGALTLTSAFGAFLDSSTIGGNVNATSTGFVYLIGSSATNVTSTNGATYLSGARLAKNLSTTGDSFTDVYDSVIRGTLTVDGAELGSTTCTSEIDGVATYTNTQSHAGSLLQIGATAPQTGCGFDIFGAGLTLTNNTAVSFIGANVVRGDFSCTGNTPAPTGTSSRIRGPATGQCSALAVAPTGLPTTRVADKLAAANSRTADAHALAVQTGPAPLVSGSTPCSGTVANQTIAGDVVVPAGQACEMTNTVVNGKVTVQGNASLLLSGSTAGGAVAVQTGGYVSAVSSTMAGAVTLSGAFGAYAQDSSFGGNITATGSGFVYSVGSTGKALTSTNGETYLESSWLTKNLSTNGDALTDINNSVVEGTTFVSNPHQGSVVCASEFDQAGSFSGAQAGVVQIGAGAGCAFDVFGATLTLSNNAAPAALGPNVIRSDLSCTGNSPAPSGTSSRLRGQASGQCS